MWRDAGANVGWMKDVPPQQAGAYDFWAPWRERGEAGAMPAFGFHCRKRGELANLPDPGAAFGLDVHCRIFMDAALKELGGLKCLQALNLGGTHVTNAGPKELAGLKKLQALYLFYTASTDAGLKELAGPSNLARLDLRDTRATDILLKELAASRSSRSLTWAIPE